MLLKFVYQYFFFLLNNIPLDGCTTLHISIHLLMNIRGFSLFGYKVCCSEHSYYKILCRYTFSFLLGVYLKVELMSYMVILFSLLKTGQTVSPKSYTILGFHQQCVSVPMYPLKKQGARLGENAMIKVEDKHPAQAMSEDGGEGRQPPGGSGAVRNTEG